MTEHAPHRRPETRPKLLPALVVLVSALGMGCVSLTSYEAAKHTIPQQDLVSVDGQTVHVVDRGQGEPVLLIHGFGASTSSWRDVIPELARNHRVIAIDLNGFGWTERPEASDAYTLGGQMALVLGVLDRLGVDRAHCMGHSYGGGICLWIAGHAPERVASLVLVDAAHPSYSQSRRKAFASVDPLASIYVRGIALRPMFIRRVLRKAYEENSRVTPDLVASYLEPLRIEGSVRAFRGLTSSDVSERIDLDLGTIEQPALLVWGAQDRIIDASTGAAAAAEMPRARFVLVEDAGHNPMEEQPDALLDHVVPFLETMSFRHAPITDVRVPSP